MSEDAIALAATLRACVREGEEYEAITRAGLRAADMIERQAAQLAALRAGADTEDLHATPEAFKALEAFASARNIAADRWQKKAEAAEALVAECEPYLREGETPRERIDRERADTDAVGKLYHREKVKAENARRQALEEAAQAVERGLEDIEGCGKSKGEAEAIALMVRTMRRRAAAIRALADKPAAGGEA